MLCFEGHARQLGRRGQVVDDSAGRRHRGGSAVHGGRSPRLLAASASRAVFLLLQRQLWQGKGPRNDGGQIAHGNYIV